MAFKLATKFYVKISLQELSTKFLPVYGQNGINLHDWLNSNIELEGSKHILDTTDLTALEVDGGATIHKNLKVDDSIEITNSISADSATISNTLTLQNTTTPPINIAYTGVIPNLNAEKLGGEPIETFYALAFFFGG